MNPFRSIRQAPLTVGLIWTACILFVGVFSDTTDIPNSRKEALRKWGAGLSLVLIKTESPDSQYEVVGGSLGPLQVWDGQWWRLLVNNFHHVGLIHLLMNGCAMIYLGRIIERRMYLRAYFLFLLSSVFCVAAVSGLTGELGIGLSGVAYAQVGLLMVWRVRDESVAEEFTTRMVLVAGVWLLFCQIITYEEIYPIGNGAHYTGLIYGWIWGQVYLETRQRSLFRFVFGASHLLLYPAFWFILHPFWLGSWHFYESQKLELMHGELQRSLASATEQERPGIEQKLAQISARQKSESWHVRKLERLQTALLLEPSIEKGWLELSHIYEQSDDRRLALRTALEGLKHNRGSDALIHQSVDLWVQDEQYSQDSNVPQIVEQVFAAEADDWKEKLSAQVVPQKNRLAWQPDELAQMMGLPRLLPARPTQDPHSSKLDDSPLDQPYIPSLETQPAIPEIDPSQPDSALEGTVF